MIGCTRYSNIGADLGFPVSERVIDTTLLTSDYVVFARCSSRVKRADLPAFWVSWADSGPGWVGFVVGPGCPG